MTALLRSKQAIAVGILVLIVLVFLIAGLRSESLDINTDDRTSSYYADGAGALAVYLTLSELLPDVGRLRRPFSLTRALTRAANASW